LCSKKFHLLQVKVVHRSFLKVVPIVLNVIEWSKKEGGGKGQERKD
jgi:hypothetical protein